MMDMKERSNNSSLGFRKWKNKSQFYYKSEKHKVCSKMK